MLLQQVKDYLKITWDSEDTELNSIIKRGKATLNSLTGTTIDFEEEGLSQALLLDYCRYSYNNGLEYFQDNFAKELLHLQLVEGIKSLGGDGV